MGAVGCNVGSCGIQTCCRSCKSAIWTDVVENDEGMIIISAVRRQGVAVSASPHIRCAEEETHSTPLRRMSRLRPPTGSRKSQARHPTAFSLNSQPFRLDSLQGMRLFICYARESIEKVRRTLEVFTLDGHQVWLDERTLPGKDWQEELADQIARNDVFVYAATTASLASEWCQWELAKAVRLGKAIIPILLEPGLSVPDSLKKLQWADCSKGISGLEGVKLLRALDHLQKIPVAEAPPLPDHPKGVPSRAWDTFERVMDTVATTPLYDLTESEEVIEKYFASLTVGLDQGEGRLVLTNRRVLFEIPRFMPFRRRASLALQLSDIESVTASWKFGIFPSMTIRCQSGEEHRFLVWNSHRVISRIEEQRKRVRSSLDGQAPHAR